VDPSIDGRRLLLRRAMETIRESEKELSARIVEGLNSIGGITIYGASSLDQLDRRVPTVSFRMENFSPAAVSKHLASKDIQVWDGNSYALAVTQRLDLEDKGGVVRVGATHYNTPEEISRLMDVLGELRLRG
jgi:selenocysteine lyase/cysteine desulfurase